ncbi:GIY-YIG nuclease family protein [Vibrio paucivorans]|uniref:GIY-YIG nuclease family protein n=1 Tax=Vibrio paucivorans TaxID=2829489 RepID=UPI002435D0E0|nr:GIY-YIG nuclease family protein [Vibrio paucivorans]
MTSPANMSSNTGICEWYAYFVRMPNNALYCGITTDVERRFSQHCQGKGAKALKGKSPLTLVWSENAGTTRSDATKLELYLKRLPKQTKEALVSGELSLTQVVEAN